MSFEELILNLAGEKVNSRQKLEKQKRKFAKKHQVAVPKTYQLLRVYRKLVAKGTVVKDKELEKCLLAKPTRTLSGVAPLTVLLKPFACPGKCLYCPDQKGIPRSYLADEPAVLRARKLGFNPWQQVKYRLEVFELMGHPVDKVELIILGGSFSFYPENYRKSFVKACFEAANGRKAKSLSIAQRINEKAGRRIIGITVETRPDLVNEKEIRFLRQLGVTRVELGVQSLDEAILKKNRRGHGLKEVIRTTQLLKDAGFKVGYHLMPGLPGSSWRKDLSMIKKVFSSPLFRPDFLKIYPCVVLKEAPLFKLWQKGKYRPLEDEKLVKLLVKMKSEVPRYVRINRLGRDIPLPYVVAGFHFSHIRQMVAKEMEKQGLTCRCVRCREIKGQSKVKSPMLKVKSYRASWAREFFLELVDSCDRLYALLRLRLPSKNTRPIFPVLKGAALVRELHVFGQSLAIGEKKEEAVQHGGLGKQLMAKAEEIALNSGFKKVAVIAGVGAREYYRKMGYKLKQSYIFKEI